MSTTEPTRLVLTIEVGYVEGSERFLLMATGEDSIETLYSTVKSLTEGFGVPTSFAAINFTEVDDFFKNDDSLESEV